MKNFLPLLSFVFILLASMPLNINANNSKKTLIKQGSVSNTGNTEQTTKASKKVSFVFKMDYHTSNSVPLTAEDAKKLHEFMSYGKEMVNCNATEVSVTSQEKVADETVLVKVVDELQVAGYQVNDLVCDTESVTFSISKLEGLCGDCNQIEISKALVEKFENEDYGEALIDFGFGEDEEGFNSFELPDSPNTLSEDIALPDKHNLPDGQ